MSPHPLGATLYPHVHLTHSTAMAMNMSLPIHAVMKHNFQYFSKGGRDPGKPRFIWSIGVTARLGNNHLLIAVADQCPCLLFSPIAMTKCQRRSSLREWLVWLTVRRVHTIPAGKLQQPELEAACSYLGKSGSSRRWMMASPTPSLFIWSRRDGAVPFSISVFLTEITLSRNTFSRCLCHSEWPQS